MLEITECILRARPVLPGAESTTYGKEKHSYTFPLILGGVYTTLSKILLSTPAVDKRAVFIKGSIAPLCLTCNCFLLYLSKSHLINCLSKLCFHIGEYSAAIVASTFNISNSGSF